MNRFQISTYDPDNSKEWEGEGGSAKQVTIEEFPVFTKDRRSIDAA